MAAPLFYKAIVGFYQEKVFSSLGLQNQEQLDQVSDEPFVITCKSPVGLTRQERYERIKTLMNR